MSLYAIKKKLTALANPRWQPRLNLTSSERDNLFRYDGGDDDHFEVYVIKLHMPRSRAALWLRHELRFAAGRRLSPRMRNLAVLYDHRSGERHCFTCEVELSDLDFGRCHFGLQLGDCRLAQARSQGQFAEGLNWDLSWEPRRVSARPLFFDSLYDSSLVPSKMLVPNDAVPAWGQVQFGDRVFDAEGGHLQQAHLWGRESPLRWMAAHVDAYDGRPDCRLEAYQVQDHLGDRLSPWVRSVRITYRHHTYFFPRVFTEMASSGAHYGSRGFSFSVGRGALHFRGRVSLEPRDLVAAAIDDPGGRRLFVSTAARASSELEVLRRGGFKFHRETLVRAEHSAWFELAADSPPPEALRAF